MNIGDLFYTLRGDGSQLVVDAQKSGAAAAQAFGLKFKSVADAGKIVAGAALAIATVQGAQLNQVLNDLQAETGATGEDWAAMQGVVRRENGRTTESIDQIADATKSMRQDLHLTGDEIDKYADHIFNAGLATHTSAATISADTAHIADGYNVNIDRALGSIDQIIASQEKWGGSIQDRLAVLPTLAKALRGLNGTLDDGVALLNVASASGLGYETVQKALNTAVGKFKIPPTLQEIIGLQDKHASAVSRANGEVQTIEDTLAKFEVPSAMAQIVATLNAIPDPTERARAAEELYNAEVAKFNADPLQRYLDILAAIPDDQARTQRATELFGGKAGPIWAQLAGTIGKSGGTLEAFNVTQTEAGDKADEVARKIDSGPVRSLQLLGEKLGSLLADAGSNTLVTGIASIGTVLGGFAPNLSGKIASGIAGAVKAAWKKVGADVAGRAVVKFAADQAATVYLKALFLGDAVSDAVRRLWVRVVESAIVQSAIERAGSVAATAYLKYLIAGDVISGAISGLWARIAGSAVVTGAVEAAGSAGATAYLKALFVGDALAGAVAAAWARVPGSALLASAITAVGTAAFGVLAGAITVAALAAPIAIAVLLIPKIQSLVDPNDLHGQLNQLTDDVASGKRVYVDAGKQNANAYVEAATETIATQLGPAINDELERLRPGLVTTGTSTGKKYGDAVVSGAKRSLVSTGGVVASAISSTFAANLPFAHIGSGAKAAGNRLAGAVAQGIRDKRAAVDQAWADLLDAIKHQIKPATERSHLLGELASKALIRGLHSKDPEVRAQARYTKQVIIDRLTELGANAHNIGTKGMEALRRAMHSKDPDIRAAALAIYHAATQPVSKLPAAGTTYGSNFIKNVIAGMNSQQTALALASAGLAGIARDHFQLSSPAKVGPWSKLGGPEGWGRRFSAYVVRGIAAGLPDLNATLSQRMGNLPSLAGSVPGTLGLAGGVPAVAGDSFNSGSVTFGDIHLHGIGSDVSPAAAQRFGQSVLAEVSRGFREQARRRGIHAAVIP